MDSNRPLNPFTRGIIVGLRISGCTYEKIEEHLIDIQKSGCLRTIKNICKQWQDERDYQTKVENCGRQKVMSEEQVQDLVDHVTEKPLTTRKSLQQNKEINPLGLTAQTLTNYLNQAGCKQKKRPSTFFISQVNKDNRVRWCQNMLRD